MTDWIAQHQKLNEMEQYVDNWDSYGGKPIDKGAIALAHRILNVLQRGDFHVVPCSDGTIQIEAELLFDYLEIDVIDGDKIVAEFVKMEEWE